MKYAALAILLFSAAAPATSAQSQPDAPPNILIILCDDLGYGDLAHYGHPHIQTPHLDKLADQGAKLTDCYAAAPVCSPARVGLLTGRTPSRTGVYDWIPPDHPMHLVADEITLATLLKQAGYRTAHAGKWHCNGKFNSEDQPQPGDHGFDHWFSTQNNAAPSHENPRNFVRNGESVGPLNGFSCQLVADEGVDWLKRHTENHADAPFFLHINFHEPHEPVESPDHLVEQYMDVAEDEDEAQYFANVTNMDAAVGKLMRALDEMDLTDNTLVFFTSDNGPETLDRYPNADRSHGSPGPLRGMKLHIYEGGIRVPGILRWPGRTEPGQVINEPISSVDLLPTLCQIAGVEPPADRALDGTSFLPIFDGNPIERHTPLFWHYYRAISPPRVAMRDGDWKIVGLWDAPTAPAGGNVNPESQQRIKSAELTGFELYNLREDRAEQNNLADNHPDRVEEMSETLKRMYRDVREEGRVWEFEENE